MHIEADYVFEVAIRSYSNPDHRLEDGSCCDNLVFCTNPCDPYFDSFCLRNLDHSHGDTTTCFLGTGSGRVDNDDLPEVVRFTGTDPWPVSATYTHTHIACRHRDS